MMRLTALIVLALVVVVLGMIGKDASEQPTSPVVATSTTTSTAQIPAVFDPPISDNAATPPVVVERPEIPRAHETAPMSRNGHACGGDLPPCSVMMRESKGDPNAYNPTGCGGRGCYGKWQCDPRTCSGQGTEEQQDAEARALWDGGRGCQHWDACAA